MTPTSTDPLVATLFAVECRNYGEGVVLIAPRAEVIHLSGPRNYFDDLECAVNLRLSPTDFSHFVVREIDVQESLSILAKLGFTEMPVRLSDPEALRIELLETEAVSYRLSAVDVERFNHHVFGGGP